MSQGSNRKLVIAAIAAIVLIVGITIWQARGPGSPEADAGNAQDPAPRGADEDLARSSDATGAAPSRRAAMPAPSAVQGMLGGNMDPEEARRKQDELAQDLEAAHNAQPVDAAWKGKTEARMTEIAANEGLRESGIAPDGLRADCRSSSCRVSAEFGKPGDADDWATMFITMTGKEFQRVRYVTVPTADGGTEVRIYGTRR